MRNTPSRQAARAFAIVGVLVLICGQTALAQDKWSAILAPQNTLELGFVRGTSPVMRLSLGGWGPNWAWVGVSSKDKTTADKHVASVPFVVNKATGQVIDIKFSAWQSGPNELSFSYDMTAAKDVPVTMVIAAVGLDKAFAKGTVDLTADGKQTTVNLPFPRSAQPPTSKAILRMQGAGDVQLSIDPPCPIGFDGDMRIMLASEVFKQGSRTVTIRAIFNEPIALFAKDADMQKFTKTVAGPDWFAFTPTDDLAPGVIGMNDWLEKPAGKHGGVRMVKDHFEFEDATPIKFWGVNLSYGGGCAPAKKDAEFTAARYAKYGVNGVRLHKFSYPKNQMGIGDLNDATKMDPEGMDASTTSRPR
ncbi:MAG: hypothetical protein ACHRHE_05150 [Tepidisphaerales bacterium]